MLWLGLVAGLVLCCVPARPAVTCRAGLQAPQPPSARAHCIIYLCAPANGAPLPSS